MDEKVSLNKHKRLIIKSVKKRKNMTLVIGAICKEGIVLASDFKALRDDDELYAQKIIPLFENWVVLGVSGNENILDKFLRQLNPDIEFMRSQLNEEERSKPLFKGREDLLIYIERKLRAYKTEYSSDDVSLTLLLAISDGILTTLHAIDMSNPVESQVKDYLTIGHGSPYSKILMRTLWKPNMDMLQTSALIHFVYKVIIDLKLDITVGYPINIVFIENGKQARDPTDDEKNNIIALNDKFIENFNNFVKNSKLLF